MQHPVKYFLHLTKETNKKSDQSFICWKPQIVESSQVNKTKYSPLSLLCGYLGLKKKNVCLRFADRPYCFHADPKFFMVLVCNHLHLNAKCVIIKFKVIFHCDSRIKIYTYFINCVEKCFAINHLFVLPFSQTSNNTQIGILKQNLETLLFSFIIEMISKTMTETKLYKIKCIVEVHFTSCFPQFKYFSSYLPCHIP